MYPKITIDGQEFHATENGEVLKTETGTPIPSYFCICGATDEKDCQCGSWEKFINMMNSFVEL